ncbi:SRPBCC family protein [Actinokineospora auranticolor]|uniref:Polyketide cyclase/dehydrase/lipid transport protein n=1 Tax=Actinokineospora auranticolor TaxID=155976 RepID=A0A2S6GHB5_9PSEU|nr:SRPBCC family protein [Actinokineospora auranticolor]PPK64561.1 polyketide cyclase/dehydrase/lipid transport protein [Actinokineospora auranticolor]
MNQVQALAERTIAAPVDRVRAAVADYAGVRGRILTPHFSEYEVRSGGVGAGTVAHWRLQATSKRVRDCVVEVSEPRPGSLVEADRNSTLVTTWTVEGSDSVSTVRIATTWEGANGVGGFFERLFAPAGLKRIHDQVLANLAKEF